MAIVCPRCGAAYDVTLFQFGRPIRCDCGAWVDLDSGHRREEPEESSGGAEASPAGDLRTGEDERGTDDDAEKERGHDAKNASS